MKGKLENEEIPRIKLSNSELTKVISTYLAEASIRDIQVMFTIRNAVDKEFGPGISETLENFFEYSGDVYSNYGSVIRNFVGGSEMEKTAGKMLFMNSLLRYLGATFAEILPEGFVTKSFCLNPPNSISTRVKLGIGGRYFLENTKEFIKRNVNWVSNYSNSKQESEELITILKNRNPLTSGDLKAIRSCENNILSTRKSISNSKTSIQKLVALHDKLLELIANNTGREDYEI